MFTIDSKGLRALRDELAVLQSEVPKEIKVASSKTVKKGKSITAKKLARLVRTTQKVLRAVGRGRMTGADAEFVLSGNFRISMRRFNPVQNATGVVVKALKVALTPQQQAKLTGAFMGPRPGVQAVKLRGQPMRRVGTQRLKIEAVRAIVPVEELKRNPVFVDEIVADLQTEYIKQIRERIRFLKVKMAGKLRNQK
jgi:hypothetical protein